MKILIDEVSIRDRVSQLGSQINADYGDKRHLFSAVNEGNEASARSFEKAGFQLRRRLHIVLLLGFGTDANR